MSRITPDHQQMDRSNDPEVTRAMNEAAPAVAMASRRQRLTDPPSSTLRKPAMSSPTRRHALACQRCLPIPDIGAAQSPPPEQAPEEARRGEAP